MPFTPYHFGPSGFIGLVLRKWIDFPVFVLANVVVDLEVLAVAYFGLGHPVHRYFHTLLFGTVAGLVWGLVAYRLRGLFKKIMKILQIPYQTNLLKMVISGILGVWLHVLIDGIYHWDVRVLWPSKKRPLYRYWGLDKSDVKNICITFIILAVIFYVITVIYRRKRKKSRAISDEQLKE